MLIAEWMGHPAPDVAQKVTSVLTEELTQVPGAKAVRGSSMSDMAYIDAAFANGAHLASDRDAIIERVARLRERLPPTVRIQVGPAAKATGWVFEYVLIDPTHGQSASSLRHLQDDVIRPALAAVAGVAEVAALGGTPERALVEAKPSELRAQNLAFSDLLKAFPPDPAGHPATTLGELESRRIPTGVEGRELAVRDVARVRMASEMPTGVADYGAIMRLAVGGVVISRWDARPLDVVVRVRSALDQLRPSLPRGVELITVYDRQELSHRVDTTLLRALSEEIGVVVLVILMFLLDWRSALIPLTTLPVVLMLTFGAMWLLGLPASIMSLGGIGIALGMAVDADVVALEACHRRLENNGAATLAQHDRRDRLIAAAAQFTPAILTSLLITALSFLPVFAFTGETGRLLRPLALSKTLVVLSGALVALTVAPALRDRFLGGRVVPEFENPLTRRLVQMYRPLVHFALRRPALTLLTALLAVASCLPILGRLGGILAPRR